MPSNAIKFVYGATTVYFDVEEVMDTVWGKAQEYQVQEKQAAAPNVKYIGNDVDSITITFDLRRQGTADKIDQIVDALTELTLYPSLQYDDTANVKVVPLVDGMEEVDTYGWQDAEQSSKTITFLKSGT